MRSTTHHGIRTQSRNVYLSQSFMYYFFFVVVVEVVVALPHDPSDNNVLILYRTGSVLLKNNSWWYNNNIYYVLFFYLCITCTWTKLRYCWWLVVWFMRDEFKRTHVNNIYLCVYIIHIYILYAYPIKYVNILLDNTFIVMKLVWSLYYDWILENITIELIEVGILIFITALRTHPYFVY